MKYSKIEIIAKLNARDKKVSSHLCKVGDRFIIENHSTLLFKTNHQPVDGKYLCSDESGHLVWLEGDLKVDILNGIGIEMNRISRLFRNEFVRNDTNQKYTER